MQMPNGLATNVINSLICWQCCGERGVSEKMSRAIAKWTDRQVKPVHHANFRVLEDHRDAEARVSEFPDQRSSGRILSTLLDDAERPT